MKTLGKKICHQSIIKGLIPCLLAPKNSLVNVKKKTGFALTNEIDILHINEDFSQFENFKSSN